MCTYRKDERRKGGVAEGGHSTTLSDKYQLPLNVDTEDSMLNIENSKLRSETEI